MHLSQGQYTQRTVDRLQVYINKCLQRIVNIHWSDTIANKDLWNITDQEVGTGTQTTEKKKIELA